jgi:hypothetical protein
MKKLNKYELDSISYNKVIHNQISNNNDVLEIIVSGRKKLYKTFEPKKVIDNQGKEQTVYKSLLCVNKLNNDSIGNITIKSFMLFLAEFKINLNKNLTKNNELWNLHIDYENSKQKTNINNWNDLEVGSYFYCIDFKSAYWQMAYKLGYIDDRIYNQYINLDDYKSAKRLCFSFLSRSVKGIFHNKKVDDGKILVIDCDNSFYRNIYNNVRNLLNNYLIEMVNITNNNYMYYNTDGIYINKDSVNIIKSFLNDEKILYKTTICKKINDKQYFLGNKLKQFIK